MVTCPNYLLEFNAFHVNQITECCERLFSVDDVPTSVEIWQHHYARSACQDLEDITYFMDTDDDTCNSLSNEVRQVTLVSDSFVKHILQHMTLLYL